MDVFGIFPRAGAIVLAVILIAISAATIGVINDNDDLVRVRDFDGPGTLNDDGEALQALIRLSQAAAGWLIFLNGVIVIAEIIAIVLVIVNLQETVKIVFGILEIIFSILVMLCFFVSGIACAAYAAAWGEPPDTCERADNFSDSDNDDLCDSEPLTATNSLEAAFCFLQIGAFGIIIFVTVLGLIRSCNISRPEKA